MQRGFFEGNLTVRISVSDNSPQNTMKNLLSNKRLMVVSELQTTETVCVSLTPKEPILQMTVVYLALLRWFCDHVLRIRRLYLLMQCICCTLLPTIGRKMQTDEANKHSSLSLNLSFFDPLNLWFRKLSDRRVSLWGLRVRVHTEYPNDDNQLDWEHCEAATHSELTYLQKYINHIGPSLRPFPFG